MADPPFFARLFEFIIAVGDHWLAWVTGVVLVIEPFAEALLPQRAREWLGRKFGPHRRGWLFGLSALFFLYACFQAFDDEAAQLRSAQTQLVNNPGQQAQIDLLTRQIAQMLKMQDEEAKPRHPPKDFPGKLSDSLKSKGALRSVALFYIAASSDSNSANYAVEIYRALKAAGLHIEIAPLGSQEPRTTGIMIYLFDPNRPSQAAKELLAMFGECGVQAKVVKWEDHEQWPPTPDFMIFVTREQPIPD